MSALRVFRAATAIWVIAALFVLAVTLYGFDGKPNSDIGVVLAWSMLALAFPSSVVVMLLLTAISIAAERLFGMVIPTSYATLTVTWLCLFAVGYWQWSKLLPWMWRKWTTRDGPGNAA